MTLRLFHHAGVLVLPTGRLVACDPFIGDGEPFAAEVPPGRYPVVLSIAHFGNDDQRVAFATVRFRSSLPEKWEPAVLAGEDVEGAGEGFVTGYPVDSGTGCFMDLRAARCLGRKMDHNEDYWQRIMDELSENYVDTWGWVNRILDRSTGANLVAFSSGYGDGAYASFFGYGAASQAVCLVTDFGVVAVPDK
jgi:hypothetical protein